MNYTQEQHCFVYILASRPNGTLYVGKTTDLVQRVWQHKAGLVPGFTKKYSVHKLVYYEIHDSEENALLREKRIKRWRRAWKIQMIEESNPEWEDLYDSVTP